MPLGRDSAPSCLPSAAGPLVERRIASPTQLMMLTFPTFRRMCPRLIAVTAMAVRQTSYPPLITMEDAQCARTFASQRQMRAILSTVLSTGIQGSSVFMRILTPIV